MALNLGTFARGFIAKLIDSEASAIRPHSLADRIGFQNVVAVLDRKVEEMRRAGIPDKSWYKEVVRLRNELRPSNNGSFDSFETALRDLQLSLTTSPNPFYEEIEFSVSKPFARSVMDELATHQRNLIADSVVAFLEARRSAQA